MFCFIEHSLFLCVVDRGSCCSKNEELYGKYIGLCHLSRKQADNRVGPQCMVGVQSPVRAKLSLSHLRKVIKLTEIR